MRAKPPPRRLMPSCKWLGRRPLGPAGDHHFTTVRLTSIIEDGNLPVLYRRVPVGEIVAWATEEVVPVGVHLGAASRAQHCYTLGVCHEGNAEPPLQAHPVCIR